MPQINERLHAAYPAGRMRLASRLKPNPQRGKEGPGFSEVHVTIGPRGDLPLNQKKGRLIPDNGLGYCQIQK
jgi:hypothetical protein